MTIEFKSLTHDRAEIRIDGVIGGGWFDEDPVTAKSFAKNLKALGKPKSLDIYINSPGGSVFDGNAIHEQLKRHTAQKTVYVEGLAASIASVIAMAGDEIVIPENAYLMIHRVSGMVAGDAADMRKTADTLEKIESGIVAVYAAKTGRDAAEINEMMADETWMTGPEAVALGFADRTTDALAATACLTPDVLQHFKTPPVAMMTPSVSTPKDVPMTDEAQLENSPPAAESATVPLSSLLHRQVRQARTHHQQRLTLSPWPLTAPISPPIVTALDSRNSPPD
jgi:ATP-dependent protease ClpP protease subunit